MSYWRMQLHPSDPGFAVEHTITSLAAGFIGLDFGRDVGNLLLLRKDQLPAGHQDYWDFAHKMRRGDVVLIVVHHFPFALAKVAGHYNYIRKPEPHIGVWFRHFRPVKEVMFYADWLTNAHQWQQIPMTEAISRLNEETSKSYQLIRKWLRTAR